MNVVRVRNFPRVSLGVEFAVTPKEVETIALLTGMPVLDISLAIDTHLVRGME